MDEELSGPVENGGEAAQSASPQAESAQSEPVTRRDGLEAIYDKLESGENKDAKTPIEKGREEKSGRFTKKPGQQMVPVKKGVDSSADARTAAAQASPQASAPSLKAPAALNAQERQHWDKTPPEIQKAILRREQETAQILSRWKPATEFQQAFHQTIQPFEHILRQQAAMSGRQYNPLETVRTLMTTGATLMHGSPHQKAETVASIIKGYGVDVGALADMLEGTTSGPTQGQPAGAPSFNPEAWMAQAVQKAEARFAQNLQRTMSERMQRDASAELETFAASGKEYFEDVRQEMADIIDLISARNARLPEGQKLAIDLEDVYRRACSENAVVAPLFKQQEAVAAAEKAKGSTQSAQRAAGSIRSRPGSSARATPPPSRRASLDAAYEKHFG